MTSMTSMTSIKKPRLYLLSLSIALLGSASTILVTANNSPTTSAATPQQEKPSTALATFAGGCFWCMEKPFEGIEGVKSVISGYIGGHKENPRYEEVSSGSTGHTEAVQISFDPAKLSYETLLEIYWRQFDPTDAGGSFVDRGNQYRSGIFYYDDTQRQLAEASKTKLGQSGLYESPIVTEITPAGRFYPAEDYHQDYYKNNPVRYQYYRYRSGRDQYIEKITAKAATLNLGNKPQSVKTSMENSDPKAFKKPSADQLKQQLTALQYEVTQEEGTERPFKNEYWDQHEAGIYVDIVSGEALFSSTDKFDSGTGWPSFTKPIQSSAVKEKEDGAFFMKRVEVRSLLANSHLGHVFKDGPAPTGLRYCINSASLRFIPKAELEAKGYAEFTPLFDKK